MPGSLPGTARARTPWARWSHPHQPVPFQECQSRLARAYLCPQELHTGEELGNLAVAISKYLEG